MNLIQIQTNAMQTTVDPHALVTTTPIMELIAQHPELQPILDGLGLDTCCGGHLTVTEAGFLGLLIGNVDPTTPLALQLTLAGIEAEGSFATTIRSSARRSRRC